MQSQIIIQKGKYDEEDTKIFFLSTYHPYYGGSNPKFDNFSKLILDIKDKKPSAINIFFKKLNHQLDKGFPIVTIPSSNPNNINTGINKLASLLAKQGRIDASSCLLRHIQVPKKSKGGNRDINIDLNSIKVSNQHLIKGKTVLLLDDVTTTGNSFVACEKLLVDAGAYKVVKLALGKTASY